jgi:hypothetical protein
VILTRPKGILEGPVDAHQTPASTMPQSTGAATESAISCCPIADPNPSRCAPRCLF